MALDAVAKVSNVYRSLYKYFHDTMYLLEGVSVDFEGLKFNEVDKSEWVQPRVVDILSQYIGHASNTQYGEQCDILFQTNIFVKKSDMRYTDRAYTIRDKVANYFRCRQKIALSDYSSGSTTALDYMRVRRILDDRPLPETQELHQYVISFEIDFTKAVTKPNNDLYVAQFGSNTLTFSGTTLVFGEG